MNTTNINSSKATVKNDKIVNEKDIYDKKKRKIYPPLSRYSRQQGATIFEILAWSILSLVVLGGAVVIWRTATENITISSTQKEIMTIQSNVRSLFAGQDGYEGLSTSVVIKGGMALPYMISSENSSDGGENSSTDVLVNKYKGKVEVDPDSNNSRQFTIKYTNIPQNVCIKLSSLEGDWEEVTVGSQKIKNPGDAASACENTNTGNIVTWIST